MEEERQKIKDMIDNNSDQDISKELHVPQRILQEISKNLLVHLNIVQELI